MKILTVSPRPVFWDPKGTVQGPAGQDSGSPGGCAKREKVVQEQVRDGRGLLLGATSTLDLEHLREQGWQALLRWRKAAPGRHSLFLGCSDSQESDSRAQWVRKKVDELAVGSEQL